MPKTSKPTQIKTIAKLKKAITNEENEFFILLAGGIVKSSKNITLEDDGKFNIVNEIDDTTEILTEEELFDKDITNIGLAMKRGAFYKY